ncbi:MAG: OmpA family protein [Ruminococcaceae bacterium]|nr:OmpA family protein [Oscillospiraceae bacterium]
MKKITSVILIITIIVTLFASCKKEEASGESVQETTTTAQQAQQNAAPGDSSGFLIGGEDHVELGKPDKYLDPQEVYSKIEYTPEMFRGDYWILGGEEAKNELFVDAEFTIFNYNGEDREIALTPYCVEAGKHTTNHVVSFVEGYNWARLSFPEKLSGDRKSYFAVFCAYTIEGNKIIFTPFSNYSYDDATEKITYAFSDVKLEFEFSFCGTNLTLSTDEKSVTYSSSRSISSPDETRIYVSNYISDGSKKLNNINYISMTYTRDDARLCLTQESVGTIYDSVYVYNSVALMEDNGRITMTIPFETGTKTYQFVYFYCGSDGIILTDGENTYYYNASHLEYKNYDTRKYLSEDQTGQIDNLTDAELEAIVEKKDNLLTDLADAFEAEGINVTINEEYGELVIDSSVIFGGDSAVLSADGKAFLNKFLKAYTSIVFSPEYEDFILKTVVEGHTAPVSGSTYESGLPLSEERAEVVRDYCISSETGVDTTKLANALEAVGYSNSKPIHDADGNVDMDASRRVSFKFIINLDA